MLYYIYLGIDCRGSAGGGGGGCGAAEGGGTPCKKNPSRVTLRAFVPRELTAKTPELKPQTLELKPKTPGSEGQDRRAKATDPAAKTKAADLRAKAYKS